MRVTVTGASGTIGLAVVNMLIRAGHEVRAFVRRPQALAGRCRDDRVEVVVGDVLDRAAVADTISGSEAIVHCVDFPGAEIERSWDALRHALEALRPRGSFVFPGVTWVYGASGGERREPEHPKDAPSAAGEARAELERAVTAEGGTVVRLPAVYGPGLQRGPLYSVFERAIAGKTVRLPGDLERPVEFLYIDDAARALVAPLGRAYARGVDYHAPGIEPITPRRFAELIFKSAGGVPRIKPLPRYRPRIFGGRGRDDRGRSGLSYLDECAILLDGGRTRRQLGWRPEIDHAEGVRRTVRWMKSRRAPTPVDEGPA